jgi:hypothetical protein
MGDEIRISLGSWRSDELRRQPHAATGDPPLLLLPRILLRFVLYHTSFRKICCEVWR